MSGANRVLLAVAAEVTRLLAAGGAPLAPVCYGTKVENTSSPLASLLRSVSGVTVCNATDGVVTVRAGTPISELRTVLAETGQMVLLDHSVLPNGSVGGGVAFSDLLPVGRIFGRTGSQIVSASWVTPAHGLVQLGAPTLKNVAGYHLEKLLPGSRGLFGIILSITLRTVPLSRLGDFYLFDETDGRNRNALLAAVFRSHILDILIREPSKPDCRRILMYVPKNSQFPASAICRMSVSDVLAGLSGILPDSLSYAGAVAEDTNAVRHHDNAIWVYVRNRGTGYTNVLTSSRAAAVAFTRLEDEVLTAPLIGDLRAVLDPEGRLSLAPFKP